jgi:hypothetical protein
MKVTQLLSKFPQLKHKLVDLSIAGLNVAAHNMASLIKELIIIQGGDPNTSPEDKARREIFNQLNTFHTKDFDEDFNFSALKCNKIDKVNKELNLDLSRSDFIRLTDIANLNDHVNATVVAIPQVAVSSQVDDVNNKPLKNEESTKDDSWWRHRTPVKESPKRRWVKVKRL